MERTQEALAIGRRYTLVASGASVVLSLGWDLAATCAVQIRMISEIAQIYGVPVKSARARIVAIGMAGSLTSFSHGVPGWLAAQASWLMPLGTVLKPGYAAVVTYAMANVVTLHFERGGTLENLTPTREELREAFQSAYKEVRSILPAWAQSKASSAPGADASPAPLAALPAPPAPAGA